jgi:hypothetical protein
MFNKNKNNTILLFVIYRLLLEYTYINFVSPIFDYEGYPFAFDTDNYLISWGIFLFIILCIPKKIDRPSTFLIVYFILVSLTPLLVFYALAGKSTVILFKSLFILPMLIGINRVPLLKIKTLKYGRELGYLLIFTFLLFGTISMIFNGGLNYFNLDLEKVYDFREDSELALDNGIYSYLNNWLPKVFAPCLLSILLLENKIKYVALVFLLSVFWFSMSGHKSVIFYPFISLIIYLTLRKSESYNLILYSLISVVSISFLLFLYNKESYLIPSMFIRRVFFVPSSLWFAYFEFFEQNELIYWSNSFMAPFITYPYSVPPPKVIGDFVGTGAWANNSFIPNGYMHFGTFGVLLYGVIVSIILYLIDIISSKNVPVWFTISIFIVPFHILSTSSDLVTALLTHGIALSLLLIYFLSSRSQVFKIHNQFK